MTNSELLKETINEKGIKTGFICEKLGISRQALSKRLAAKSDFRADEIAIMCNILNLSAQDMNAIFFDMKLANCQQLEG